MNPALQAQRVEREKRDLWISVASQVASTGISSADAATYANEVVDAFDTRFGPPEGRENQVGQG